MLLRTFFGADPQDMKSSIERILYEDGEPALASLDRRIVSELNKCSGKGVMNDLLSDGLLKTPGRNCISLMTISGAKGSKVSLSSVCKKFSLFFFLLMLPTLCRLTSNKSLLTLASKI